MGVTSTIEAKSATNESTLVRLSVDYSVMQRTETSSVARPSDLVSLREVTDTTTLKYFSTSSIDTIRFCRPPEGVDAQSVPESPTFESQKWTILAPQALRLRSIRFR